MNPQQEPDEGEFPRKRRGELKWLYGCGISDKTPPPPLKTHSFPAAEVMASSKWGNKREQPALFHWRSSCAQGEPSALRLNQYERCALQPRTHVSRHPGIAGSFTPRSDGLQQTDTTFPGSLWSDQSCVSDRMGDFHPRSNQLKPQSESTSR